MRSPSREAAQLFAEYRDALLPARIVGALRAVLQFDRQPVGWSIDALHLRVLALADAGFLRCARVAQHVAHLVPLGPGTIRAGEVLARHQRSDVMLCAVHRTPALQLRMDALVDLHAGAIVGRDNQCALRRICIFLRNRRNALAVVGNLVDAALPVKILDCLSDFASRKLLDDPFQFRVFLAHDLIEPDRHHARILKLRKWPSCLYCFMLPPVANQQHAVVWMEPVDELMQLPGRCHRGFVEHVQTLLARVGLLTARQMLLECRCLHARLGELLRRARCGREAFDVVSLGRCCFTNHG